MWRTDQQMVDAIPQAALLALLKTDSAVYKKKEEKKDQMMKRLGNKGDQME